MRTGAELVRYALERIGACFTFGIPGVHTTKGRIVAHATDLALNVTDVPRFSP